jgi:hypothetical protein
MNENNNSDIVISLQIELRKCSFCNLDLLVNRPLVSLTEEMEIAPKLMTYS